MKSPTACNLTKTARSTYRPAWTTHPRTHPLFIKAVGHIARARGMKQLSRDTGMTREGHYKALGERGNPTFATVVKVMHALGLQFKKGGTIDAGAEGKTRLRPYWNVRGQLSNSQQYQSFI